MTEPKKGWFQRLTDGLSRSSRQMTEQGAAVFVKRPLDQEQLAGRGAKVLIAAGDTFRAAAVEQLQVWAHRAKADFMSRPTGADAAGLAYDAVEKARSEGYDVVLIDTAGRLQNKTALMDELAK